MIVLSKTYIAADGKFPPYIDSSNYLTHHFVMGSGSVIGCLYKNGCSFPSAIFIDTKFLGEKTPTETQEPHKMPQPECPKPENIKEPHETHEEERICADNLIGEAHGVSEYGNFDSDAALSSYNRRKSKIEKLRIARIQDYVVDMYIYGGEVVATKYNSSFNRRKIYKDPQHFLATFAADFMPRPHEDGIDRGVFRFGDERPYSREKWLIDMVLDRCLAFFARNGYF